MAVFNPEEWTAVPLGESVSVFGEVVLRADRAFICYVLKDKVGEAPAVKVPFGSSGVMAFSMPAGGIIEVVTANAAAIPSVWRWTPPISSTLVPAVDEEVFTNIDRMPDESGAVLEVRKAMRELELQRRAVLAEIRYERDFERDNGGVPPVEPPMVDTGNGAG